MADTTEKNKKIRQITWWKYLINQKNVTFPECKKEFMRLL